MKCKVCGIKLVDGKPEPKFMPCGVAPRHYVERSPEAPAKVIGVIEGCPFEVEQTPDFLPKTAMADYNGAEKQNARATVEKYYEDPQDFRPAGHRKDHTITFPPWGRA